MRCFAALLALVFVACAAPKVPSTKKLGTSCDCTIKYNYGQQLTGYPVGSDPGCTASWWPLGSQGSSFNVCSKTSFDHNNWRVIESVGYGLYYQDVTPGTPSSSTPGWSERYSGGVLEIDYTAGGSSTTWANTSGGTCWCHP